MEMAATQLIEAIEQIKKSYETPPSNMEVVRYSVLQQLARMNDVEIPPLLTDEQRQTFIDNADKVADFLRSEDGADSVELLVNAFKCFCDGYHLEESEE